MQPKRKKWMNFVPDAALHTYQKAGFLSELKFGERSALIVVDVTYGFTGLKACLSNRRPRNSPPRPVRLPGKRCRKSAS